MLLRTNDVSKFNLRIGSLSSDESLSSREVPHDLEGSPEHLESIIFLNIYSLQLRGIIHDDINHYLLVIVAHLPAPEDGSYHVQLPER